MDLPFKIYLFQSVYVTYYYEVIVLNCILMN